MANKEPSEIERVEARLAEWRMDFEQTKAEHATSRHANLVHKMNRLNKKITAGSKWLCEQRAAMEANRQ